jgi:hypothetical protein
MIRKQKSSLGLASRRANRKIAAFATVLFLAAGFGLLPILFWGSAPVWAQEAIQGAGTNPFHRGRDHHPHGEEFRREEAQAGAVSPN